MRILKEFPPETHLLQKHRPDTIQELHKVNNHIHTPYSYSAFKDISQIFHMAVQENIALLGINDFYTTAGYEEFYRLSLKNGVMPLFNIEFMGLVKEWQEQDFRVNDPKNPGRVYLTGKGLSYPLIMGAKSRQQLESLKHHSEVQVRKMVDKLNAFFHDLTIPLELNFDELKQKYVKELVRERHVATALREKIFEIASTQEAVIELLTNIYEGKSHQADLDDHAALENELRSNLLKKGGRAFIPEDENAFLSFEQIMEIVTDGGGIPCYPVLLDNEKGEFTDFESQWQRMSDQLISKNIGCIELIPGRNDFDILYAFVKFFHDRNFIITFGTEHNTPALKPLTVKCRDEVPLNETLKRINFEGASVIAAHQYKMARGEEGFLSSNNKPKREYRDDFVKLGKAVIKEFFSTCDEGM